MHDILYIMRSVGTLIMDQFVLAVIWVLSYKQVYYSPLIITMLINPRRACAAEGYSSLFVCLSVTTLQASVMDRTLKF